MRMFTQRILSGMEFTLKLISKQYKILNRMMHKAPRGFGADGHKWVTTVQPIISKHKVMSLLDYGCGRQTFWKALRDSYGEWGADIKYVGYDPCVRGCEAVPEGKFDLVVCTDVLEHIEPEYLDNVVSHIKGLAQKAIFLNINIHPANKTLPDGRNTHLILQSGEWWWKYLWSVFSVGWSMKEIASNRPHKDYVVLLERVV